MVCHDLGAVYGTFDGDSAVRIGKRQDLWDCKLHRLIESGILYQGVGWCRILHCRDVTRF